MLAKLFSKKEHALKMLNGELLARRLSDFRRFEDANRSDNYEGVILLQPTDPDWNLHFSVTRDGITDQITIDRSEMVGPAQMAHDVFSDLHIYCMTIPRLKFTYLNGEPVTNVYIPTVLVEKFGCHAVVIEDVRAFLGRVRQAVTASGIRMISGVIEYYGQYPHSKIFRNHNPTWKPAFLKPDRFEPEQEYRLAFHTGTWGTDSRMFLVT